MLWGVHTGEALACEGCGAASGRGRGSTFQGIISDLPGVSSVPLSPPSSTESGSGSPAATGISGAVVAEWPRAAGCRPGPYAWVSATGLGDSAATPLSAGSAKETRLELRAAILREFSTPRPGGRTAKCESVWSGHKVCGVVNHKLCGVYAKPCGVKSVWGGKAQSVWGQIKCVGW